MYLLCFVFRGRPWTAGDTGLHPVPVLDESAIAIAEVYNTLMHFQCTSPARFVSPTTPKGTGWRGPDRAAGRHFRLSEGLGGAVSPVLGS